MNEGGIYSRAADKLRDKLYLLKGQWFYKSDACDLLGCLRPRHEKDKNGNLSKDLNQEFRDNVGQVLYKWSHDRVGLILEQRGKQYRVINKEFTAIKPGYAAGANRFDFKWPTNSDEGFSFKDTIVTYKRDVIGMGGEGNKGKTCFAYNVVVENMDLHPVTLVLTENALRLEERLSHFDWVDIYKPDGDWKFEVLEAHKADEFLDIVRERRDNLIVYDWLYVAEEAYRVGDFYKAVSQTLGDGVAFILQQKRSYKNYAVGGEGARDFCPTFLLLESGKVRVDKAKNCEYWDAEGKIYRFKIRKQGSQFYDVAEVKDCPKCNGNKYIKGNLCSVCNGDGYQDVLGEF